MIPSMVAKRVVADNPMKGAIIKPVFLAVVGINNSLCHNLNKSKNGWNNGGPTLH
jgi:hypothetical protein